MGEARRQEKGMTRTSHKAERGMRNVFLLCSYPLVSHLFFDTRDESGFDLAQQGNDSLRD